MASPEKSLGISEEGNLSSFQPQESKCAWNGVRFMFLGHQEKQRTENREFGKYRLSLALPALVGRGLPAVKAQLSGMGVFDCVLHHPSHKNAF